MQTEKQYERENKDKIKGDLGGVRDGGSGRVCASQQLPRLDDLRVLAGTRRQVLGGAGRMACHLHDAGNASAFDDVAYDVRGPAVHFFKLLAECGGGSLGQNAERVTCDAWNNAGREKAHMASRPPEVSAESPSRNLKLKQESLTAAVKRMQGRVWMTKSTLAL